MDKELIENVAKAIMNEAILENWLIYLILIAISVTSSVGGAFLNSYFGRRGEEKAIKAGFSDVLDHLKQTTKATEQIKHEFATTFSDENDRKKLLREKLEELFEEIFEINKWLEEVRNKSVKGVYVIEDNSPLYRIDLLNQLYFDKCRVQYVALRMITQELFSFYLDHARETRKSLDDTGKPAPFINTSFIEYQKLLNEKSHEYRDSLIETYAKSLNI